MNKKRVELVMDALWLTAVVVMWWTSLDADVRASIIEKVKRTSGAATSVVYLRREPSPHEVTQMLDEARRITEEGHDGSG